jgi:hypothetical protein
VTTVTLGIDDLLLDLENPRISKPASQREALQQILDDQDLKLAVLAESIAGAGLNPMDRWLVLKSDDPRKYVVYEAIGASPQFKLLNNPAMLSSLKVMAHSPGAISS